MNLYVTPTAKLPKPNPINIELSKRMRAQTIFNIAALENSPYTYPEVQTLLEGVTVGGHRLEDQQLILNQDESWKALYKALANNTFSLDKDFVCQLHAIVANGEALEWGVFRSSQVGIAGTEYAPPKADELDAIFCDLMDAIKGLHPVDRAINYFLRASKAQFFFDGNKRTARLVANGILLNLGWNSTP